MMERQLNGGFQSGTPEKSKKMYVEPVLSEVTFAAEKGFATSVKADFKISGIEAPTGDDGSWI